MRHAVHSLVKKAVERVTGPATTSQFSDKGVLTPDEFVVAGDYLVRACPTWSWEGGDPKKHVRYLPPTKQYLVTRGVPCMKRATELESYNENSEFALTGDEEGWVATHRDPAHQVEDDVPDVLSLEAGSGVGEARREEVDDEDIPDMADLELAELEDEAAVLVDRPYLTAEEPEDNILKTRTYDLYITYDQYYQVPRFWLVGFDERKRPLQRSQVLEDVSEEHARKTITVDPHPHLSVTAASIHPCRHAEVMRKLADRMMKNDGTEFQVDHYFVLFLKFIASVVPTIQYDYTMAVGGS